MGWSGRCWFCGGKDHRKNECKLKTAGKKQGEPNAGPGGGRGKGATTGGKAGAVAVKAAKSSYEASATATTDGGGAGLRFCAAWDDKFHYQLWKRMEAVVGEWQ